MHKSALRDSGDRVSKSLSEITSIKHSDFSKVLPQIHPVWRHFIATLPFVLLPTKRCQRLRQLENAACW